MRPGRDRLLHAERSGFSVRFGTVGVRCRPGLADAGERCGKSGNGAGFSSAARLVPARHASIGRVTPSFREAGRDKTLRLGKQPADRFVHCGGRGGGSAMTIPSLTVIPAGAGSGKTYTIQQQLGDWVRDGLIAPERIVAMTFTESSGSRAAGTYQCQIACHGTSGRCAAPRPGLYLHHSRFWTAGADGIRL